MLKPLMSTLALSAALLIASNAEARGPVYRVEVTNLTKGQIFGPPTVVTHTRAADVFTSGEPASAGVAAIAEDADASVLTAALTGARGVRGIVTGSGPILPGTTGTIEVRGGRQLLSLVSMLVTTNDAFLGLDSVKLPRRGSLTYTAVAYDSGTEYNNELCDFIPGPPCGNVGVRDTANAEGFIYVHNGVHGGGDLDPAQHDWRNPVARIRITRIH